MLEFNTEIGDSGKVMTGVDMVKLNEEVSCNFKTAICALYFEVMK